MAVGAAAVGLLASLCGPGRVSAQEQGAVEATRVTRFAPRDVPQPSREGRCWTGSIALPRKGAWRCMSDNSIYDPCFEPAASSGVVVCDADPSEHKPGFTLKLTEPLPKEDAPHLKTPQPKPHPQPHPWIVELADGTRCRPYTGTMPFIEGLPPVRYYCEHSAAGHEAETGLLEDFKTGKRWTVTQVHYGPDPGKTFALKLINRKRVPIRAVWE